MTVSGIVHVVQVTESLSLTMIQASGAHSVRALIRHVRIAVLAAKRPWQICCLAVDDDGAVWLEHAPGPGDGLVGAAEPGWGVGGGDHRCSPRCGVVVLSRADHTDSHVYAP